VFGCPAGRGREGDGGWPGRMGVRRVREGEGQARDEGGRGVRDIIKLITYDGTTV
jgi:hypothetical protein